MLTLFPQTSNFRIKLYVFGDNEAVIKMIIKGKSPTMKHVSRTHRVALDWLFGRINLDPKIQIKDIDTKNQLTDMPTKGNAKKESGEERITAKSRPMMSLIARALPQLFHLLHQKTRGREVIKVKVL